MLLGGSSIDVHGVPLTDEAIATAKASDAVLNNVNMKQLNDTGELLNTLAKIMDKFDIDEIKDEPAKGFLGRIFNNAKKQLENIINKYNYGKRS